VAVSAAARNPAVLGVNATLTLQLEDAPSAAPQVVLSIAKSGCETSNSDVSPGIAANERFSPLTAAVDARVNVSAVLVVPRAAVQNAKAVPGGTGGEHTMGGGGRKESVLLVPSILKASLSPAESVTATVAARKPGIVGVKLIASVQDAPAARPPVQELLAIVKSPGAKLPDNPGTAPRETETPLKSESALMVNGAGGSTPALWLQKVNAGPNGHP